MKTKQLHYFSGITIATFVAIHLTNHTISVFGADAHIRFMATIRHIYRNPIIETALLVAVITQIISGIKLVRKKATGFFEKLHIYSGLYLAFFLTLHVSAVLIGRFVLHLDTNFYYGAAGINVFPMSLFFVPYYSLAIISFFGHVAAIHSKKMGKTYLSLTPTRQAQMIFAFGWLLTAIIFYGLTNHFNGINIPKEYNVLIGK
ncbi:hypothetical protein ACWA1C_13475 [Flectobacillus roseus]